MKIKIITSKSEVEWVEFNNPLKIVVEVSVLGTERLFIYDNNDNIPLKVERRCSSYFPACNLYQVKGTRNILEWNKRRDAFEYL